MKVTNGSNGLIASQTGTFKYDVVTTVNGGTTIFEIKPHHDLDVNIKLVFNKRLFHRFKYNGI